MDDLKGRPPNKQASTAAATTVSASGKFMPAPGCYVFPEGSVGGRFEVSLVSVADPRSLFHADQ